MIAYAPTVQSLHAKKNTHPVSLHGGGYGFFVLCPSFEQYTP